MQLEGTTSAALRQDCMQRYFTPLAAEIFAAAPEAESVIFAVAQYFNDEAQDAVHDRLVICSTADPAWPGCLTAAGNAFIEDDELDVYDDRHGTLLDLVFEAMAARHGTAWFGVEHNTQMIPAFAAYCLEGRSQEDDTAVAFLPYAIARRGASGPIIEIVGTVLRPEWEDRFDVGWYPKPQE